MIMIILFSTACSVRHKVKMDIVDDLKSNLSEIDKIKEIEVSFTRPAVRCEISVDEDFEQEDISSVTDIMKDFSTVENMKAISEKYWTGSPVGTIYVCIYYDEIRDDNGDFWLESKKTNDSDVDRYKTYRVDVLSDGEYEEIVIE